jgi:glutamate formiminotransferase/formiminotetrahydrofolate cyclodeaminase
METAVKGYEVTEAMIEKGNPNSITDAGVGVLAIHAAIEGAWLNVQVNATDVKENSAVQKLLKDGESLRNDSSAVRDRLLNLVYQKMLSK